MAKRATGRSNVLQLVLSQDIHMIDSRNGGWYRIIPKTKEGTLTSDTASDKTILDELAQRMDNPIHKRLLEFCEGDDPVASMEEELQKILLEVLAHED